MGEGIRWRCGHRMETAALCHGLVIDVVYAVEIRPCCTRSGHGTGPRRPTRTAGAIPSIHHADKWLMSFRLDVTSVARVPPVYGFEASTRVIAWSPYSGLAVMSRDGDVPLVTGGSPQRHSCLDR